MTKIRESFFEPNPWGFGVFAFVLIVGGIGCVLDKLTFGDWLGLVAAAGGLLGVGHSVHHGAKHLAEHGVAEKAPVRLE